MLHHIKSIRKYSFVLIAGALALTSCEKDFTNPGAATEAQVLNSPDGLIGLTVGIQKRWSVGRQSPVYTTVTAAGFSTFELRLINPGNSEENELSLGKAELTGTNGVVSRLWEESLLVRQEAGQVLANAEKVPDAGIRAGLIAYASIFKALANGTIAQFFEQAPLENGENATFSSRAAVLEEAIATLESARATINSTPVSAAFLDKTPASIDAANTIDALLARYHNMLGNHEEAITAANRVDPSSASTFAYDAVNTNPIAFVSILTNNVYQPVDLGLGLPSGLAPDASDQRLPFYFQDLMPEANDFRAAAFWDGATKAIPVYLPGEMDLIRAEAHARSNRIDEAVAALNAVLTKLPSEDAFGVGAGLAPYSGPMTQEAVLEAIYANRCIELMMSGLRLEDSRRFGRPAPDADGEERNRNFYPYPDSERANNPNTPPDPAI
ncbi:RagB/SusD family nutrient uptake outer membrane protein [Phaeodactylibacter luteus]|uniref:RagB/SusD family nutrient uptake outer membrane protein n=1 Tax=Phaeodactylibacter luteus TaxID=1564516 RepID=A0A5C6RU47_9BACT|nr:RagB/SusD family nutrient uptake outer membrane protein [Phaeodactylibacter luteus]TXB64872.1 RagB/SusD family nutrient uptake outer membrane protein [Phaeodactylibacter luteus]